MRILVTGSRNWINRRVILEAIEATAAAASIGEPVTVVHGACPTGADSMADMAARRLGFTPERHPADWNGPCRKDCPPGHRRADRNNVDYCPKAGHHRNQDMVDLGADVVLAFQRNQSRGTQDCMTRARAAGLVVILKEE